MSIVNTNIMSSKAQAAVHQSGVDVARQMKKLSTAKNVNSASDNASGLALINRMTSQIMGAGQALRNIQDGISLAQTVDGALGEMASMAQRMRELSLQAINDTMTPVDREMIDLEFQAIKKQMVSVTEQTTWNKIPLLQPRLPVLAQIVPAQTGGQSVIDTSAPVDGLYRLFINEQEITVELIQGEDASQRLNKITTAINAGTTSHGAVAQINSFGAIDLQTPDGRDLAAAYESVGGALTGVHLGLGGVNRAQVNQLTLTQNSHVFPVLTEGAGYFEFSGYGGSGETITWPPSTQPSTQANQFSMVNGTLYKGTGTGATALGQVDSVFNGLAGQPLRINQQASFVNGSFETTAAGTIPGWSVEQRLVRLNGQDTLAGFPVPVDTTVPAGSPGESQNVIGGTFIASVTNTTSSNGSQSVKLEMKNLLVAPFGIAHGPALLSDSPVTIQAGQTVSFDWKAVQGDDHYDVYAYLLNVSNGSTQELLNQTGTFTDWNTRTVTVNASGDYKFVFIAGGFDNTGGTAVGASLYIDNIKTGINPAQPALTSADFDAIRSQIQYADETPFGVSVSINDVTFSSDPRSTPAAALDSLLQKIAAQTDPRVANIQVEQSGNTLTVRSTNPGEGFSISTLSSTSQVYALGQKLLVANESQGDAITAIQSMADLANAHVFKGQQVDAQALEAARFLKIHVGANHGQQLALELPDYGTPGGRIDHLVWDAVSADPMAANAANPRVVHVKTAAAATLALGAIDAALTTLLSDRARLGAVTNRLIHAGDNLAQMNTEQSKSRSVIQDTHFAASVSELVKSQIINQAAMSVLAQANTQPQSVMALLRPQG
jgi:flagellin-like hook-associated protein FlgL